MQSTTLRTEVLHAFRSRRHHRRGSTLILVVATLALLAVLTVTYVSIGGGDRRIARANTRSAEVERQAQATADYIGRVVGDDVLAVYFQGFDPQGEPIFVREAVDLPRTDPNRTIDGQPVNTGVPEPQTDYFGLKHTPAGGLPPLRASDDPTDSARDVYADLLPFGPSDPFLAEHQPRYIRPISQATLADPLYDERRDWGSISNFSPSGLFSNIQNLRNNFDAEPGLGTDSDGDDRMSENLSLLDDAGRPTNQLAYGGVANPRIPAHFDSLQIRAYRPADPTLLDNPPAVDDPDYPPMQWADTDGDGFLDSRWIELVDTTDPNNPFGVVRGEGPYRWFVAVRCVDLSGLVNVNTAGAIEANTAVAALDEQSQPNNPYRLGISPADIDLRRLLILENAEALYGEFYDAAEQAPAGAQDYGAYDNFGLAVDIGDAGFDGLRAALDAAAVSPGPLVALPDVTAQDRRNLFQQVRSEGSRVIRRTAGLARYRVFGADDLAELLTYRGLNDPAITSDLERAVDGRGTVAQFGPLRSNRSLQWERRIADGGPPSWSPALALRAIDVRQHLTTLSGGMPRLSTPVDLGGGSPTAAEVAQTLQRQVDVDIALTPEDPDPTLVQDGNLLILLAGFGPEDERQPHPLFRTYANALMPSAAEENAWIDAAWDTTFFGFDFANNTGDWLFPLRTAAHLTANMIDAYDEDDEPSGFTVLTNAQSRADLDSDPGFIDAFPWWSEPNESGRLDFGDARLPDTPPPALSAPVEAMNIYGLERHPFITQVALYSVFTDAESDRAGGPGDDDGICMPMGGGGGPIFAPSEDQEVTIDLATQAGNPDYIGQVFAVQVTNPYASPVQVNSDFFVRFGGEQFDLPVRSIGPGDSVTFYAITGGEADFVSRASAAAVSFGGTFAVGAGDVSDWLDDQFTTLSGVPRVAFGSTPNSEDFLAGDPGDVAESENRRVTLWRRVNRTGGFTTDILLDRISDPADSTVRPTLDRRPPAQQFDVSGTLGTAGCEDGTVTEAGDNTGFSMVTWGTITRPKGGVAAPRGALPAYVVEVDDPINPLNSIATDEFDLGVFSLSQGDFAAPPQLPMSPRKSSAAQSLEFLFDLPASAFADNMQYAGADIARPLATDINSVPGLQFDPVTPGGPSLYIEPFRNDNSGEVTLSGSDIDVLRPGDFLGVPAFGPVHFAVPGGDPEEGWYTTGEMMGLVLGYDVASSQTGIPPAMADLLDRGHLPLDAAAPFVDFNMPGIFDGDDERRGLGIPHAMALLSSIKTTPDGVGDARTPVLGTVNVATMTETVARVLPGLSPNWEDTVDPARAWMVDALGNVLHDSRSDVAAGVLAYRDKANWPTRNGGDIAFQGAAARGDLDAFDLEGRFEQNDIEAIREHAGLLSTGEMLAAHKPSAPGLGTIGGYASPDNIRRMALDGASLDVGGVDAVRYGPNGGVSEAAAALDDEIVNDYDEQFALFNAVANSTSVRSDYFAVWFVLHGYAREDVEGLRATDPIVPSIARRYLLVLDRTGVTRAGDRPEVVVFKEIPF
ncbi:MAG: hypothetical protein AAFX79_03475 [Planctomycetota bacterium]